MNFDYKLMGRRIKQRRKELKISQSEFAEKLGISNNHLSAIENGHEKPSFDLFIRICEELKVTSDALTLGAMNTNNPPQQIIDNLKLCSKRDMHIVHRIIEILIQNHEE